MIRGVGIDLCDVARMEKSLENEHFLPRFFSGEECAYINSRGAHRAQSAAGCFAAKEALVKALGTGFAGLDLRDIGVSHTDLGAPVYALSGDALKALDGAMAHLSITHEESMAAAVAVIEA